jgi:hypothetical protein
MASPRIARLIALLPLTLGVAATLLFGVMMARGGLQYALDLLSRILSGYPLLQLIKDESAEIVEIWSFFALSLVLSALCFWLANRLWRCGKSRTTGLPPDDSSTLTKEPRHP